MTKRWVTLAGIAAAAGIIAVLAVGVANRAAAGTGGEKEITFLATGGVDQYKPHLSRKHADRVRWYNQDDRGHRIDFGEVANWPFVEPPEPILVKAGEKSRWYTVYSGPEVDGHHVYLIEPELRAPKSTPPDTPAVEVGE